MASLIPSWKRKCGKMNRLVRNNPTSETVSMVATMISASCNGDMHGAMKALLLVNEQLEAELNHLYEATAYGSPTERAAKKSLH